MSEAKVLRVDFFPASGEDFKFELRHLLERKGFLEQLTELNESIIDLVEKW